MSRQTVFELLPGVWRRLDANGTLERFLGLWEDEIGYVADKIRELADLQSPDVTEDKFLPLLGNNVGHVWKDDKSFEWNRNRIKASIRRYSYKGTTTSIEDLAYECGSRVNSIQDNASKLLILGKQGRLGCDDAYLVSKDYWHDGAFLAQFANTGDTDTLILELPSLTPAGQVWFIELVYVSQGIFDTDCQIVFTGTLTFTEALQGTIGFGTLGGNLLLSSEPNGRFDQTYRDTIWGNLFSKRMGSVGFGVLGNDVYLSDEPAIAPEMSYNPIGWHTLIADRSLGYAALGLDLFLSVEPATTGIRTLDDFVPVTLSIGPASIEMDVVGLYIATEEDSQKLTISCTSIECVETFIDIARLEMGSIHYTLSDNITLSETNR